MAAFAAYTIIGLSLGGIFSLAALGIVLIYRTTGVLNFAHGAMGMFSTFIAWQVFYGWSHPFWPGWLSTLLAVLAGLVFAAGMGLFLEFAVSRWVRTREPVVKAVITIGVLLALQSAASLIWKNNQYHLPIYLAPQQATFQLAGVPIGANYIVIVVMALGLAFGLGAFLRYTSFGRAMRAASDSPTSASLWRRSDVAPDVPRACGSCRLHGAGPHPGRLRRRLQVRRRARGDLGVRIVESRPPHRVRRPDLAVPGDVCRSGRLHGRSHGRRLSCRLPGRGRCRRGRGLRAGRDRRHP